MTAKVLDGRAVARAIWSDVALRVQKFAVANGAPPTLAVVRAGDDPASAAYLRQIDRAFAARAIEVRLESLPDAPDESALAARIAALGDDSSVHGVLVQLPLPPPLNLALVSDLTTDHAGAKDVEGISVTLTGLLCQGRPAIVPSTPLAGLELLRAGGTPLAGRHAVVVGRSAIVGRPLAQLLLQADATVTVCHSQTRDLARFTRQADILVAAAGRPALISGDMVKPGATIIDFGINEVDGRLVGDVDFEAVREVAGAISPVPGGTGPVTTAVLARNLLDLVERHFPETTTRPTM